MNEIKLSDDLNVITAEINSYKQVAGQSIFEIGKRLKHVKENDLVHGEFSDWIESVDMSHTQANRFMKVFEEIPQTKITNVGQFSFNALYEIATLPQEEREKEHTLQSGETKEVDEMTVRQLQEVKKKNKEMERQLKQSQESEKIAISQLEKEQEQEPERIEVVPDDYDYIKGNFEEAQKMREHYKEQLEEMREELKNSSEHKKIDTSEMERLERREETLKNKVSTYDKLYDIQTDLENILSVIHKKSHSLNVKSIKDEYVIIGEVDGTLNEVIKVCNELKVNLQNKNIIEGEIVNG